MWRGLVLLYDFSQSFLGLLLTGGGVDFGCSCDQLLKTTFFFTNPMVVIWDILRHGVNWWNLFWNLQSCGGQFPALHDVRCHPEGAVEDKGEEEVCVDLVPQTSHLPDQWSVVMTRIMLITVKINIDFQRVDCCSKQNIGCHWFMNLLFVIVLFKAVKVG